VASVDERFVPHGWDGHILLLHSSESERRAGLAAWTIRGLEQDERVVYTEPESEPPDRSLLGVLAEFGVDGDTAIAEGRLVVLPLLEFYDTVTGPDVLARALDEGYTGVRVSAEARTALTLLSRDAYAAAEETIGELWRTHAVSTMCQYAVAETTGSWLRQAARSHLGGIRERQLHTRDGDVGLVVGGSVDLTNTELFTAVLDAAANARAGELRLDMRGAHFLSVGACRALVEATSAFRGDGGEVVLLGTPPRVERIIRMMGLDGLVRLEPSGNG
jgi:anti-anti-sigma factor